MGSYNETVCACAYVCRVCASVISFPVALLSLRPLWSDTRVCVLPSASSQLPLLCSGCAAQEQREALLQARIEELEAQAEQMDELDDVPDVPMSDMM